MRRLALGLIAGLLATAVSAQVSVLSNPPGSSSSGAATWGSVTGTLASQTDLNTALGTKANLTGGNSFTGTQTIGSSGNLNLNGGSVTATGVANLFGATSGTTDNTFTLYNTNSRNDISFRSVVGTDIQDGLISSIRGSGVFLSSVNGVKLQFNGTTTADINTTGLNIASGKNIQFNATPVFSTSGVLLAAGFPALTGDVTTSAGALGTTIAANAVTYAKMQSVTASRLLGNPTGAGAVPSEISLAGGLTFSGTTLTAAGALTPTSLASSGAVSGTSLAGTTTILSSGATSGVGYATGAGGTVTQITSRTTGVTLNKICGAITLLSAAGSATAATFTVTDSAIAATDVVVLNQKSGTDKYILEVTAVGAGTFNITSQTTGGTTTESPVFQFCGIKGVNA